MRLARFRSFEFQQEAGNGQELPVILFPYQRGKQAAAADYNKIFIKDEPILTSFVTRWAAMYGRFYPNVGRGMCGRNTCNCHQSRTVLVSNQDIF